MKSWPSYLPRPTVEFNFSTDSNTLRTRMDSGRTRVRQRSKKSVRNVQLRWELTDQQLANFIGFFQDVISGGADEFSLPLFMGDGEKLYTVRFVGGYSTAYRPHLYWVVSARVELYNQEPFDRDTNILTYIVNGDPDYFTEQSERLHELVNETLPENN